MIRGASQILPLRRAASTLLLTQISGEVLPHYRTTWIDLVLPLLQGARTFRRRVSNSESGRDGTMSVANFDCGV